ncbi:hypothetical protein MMC34_008496 [Xylographa carneopallida]|nr:hypothetical protein [Xylographa carneopallida]
MPPPSWQNGHGHSPDSSTSSSAFHSRTPTPPSTPSNSRLAASLHAMSHAHNRQTSAHHSHSHSDDHSGAPLLPTPLSPRSSASSSRGWAKPALSLSGAFYTAFVLLLSAVACWLLAMLLFPNFSVNGCISQNVAAADSLPSSSTHLSHFDAALVQHCLGWGTDLLLPSSPLSAASALTCQLSPASVLSTFFPRLRALYPSVTTHRPAFSCHSGLYLVVDFPYTDGMGNSVWSYALSVGVAMALNATLVHDPFVATHDEEEGNGQRDAQFRHGEWAVSLEEWKRCTANSSVRANEYTIDAMYEEWRADSEGLHKARAYIQARQIELAATVNLSHLAPPAGATASYRFLNLTSATSLQAAHESVALPAVWHEPRLPGMTVHVASFRVHQDWDYEPGVMAPSLAVAEVLEARYVAQQDEWRRRLQRDDAEPPRTSRLGMDTIAVAVPVRRGDITLGTEGAVLTIPLDVRMRVMTDAAIVQMLNQTLSLVRAIRPHTVPYNSSALTASLTSALSGEQILERMRFTIYSEGSPAGFAQLVSSLVALGVLRSHIALSLNGRASVTFNLLSEADVLYMAPSSYSYASACYFNSESVKVGSGWTYSRFAGCRNFVYAPWRRYLPQEIAAGEKFVSTAAIAREQEWRVEDEADFVRRVVRMVERKREQRRRLEPIVLDNHSERYPITWMYHSKQQQAYELVDT